MATINSLICWGGLSGKTVTISNANPAVVTSTNHGLRDGIGLVLSTTGGLPTGITAGTTYYAKSTAANTFNLYDTAAHAIAGGSTGRVATSSAGSGTHTAKSDLIVNPATRLSAYGLSDLSRWWISGSNYRIYDGLNNCKTARSSATTGFDSEVIEVGDPFYDPISGTVVVTGSPNTIITSMINGVRSLAFHGGAVDVGYVATCPGADVNLGTVTNVDGLSVRPSSSTGLYLASVNSSVMNCVFFSSGTLTGTGVVLNGQKCWVENNLFYNLNQGLVNYGGDQSVAANNIAAKCAYGIRSFSDSLTNRQGFWYNNISIGCTTANWGVEPTSLNGATNNFGVSGDTNPPWAIGSGTTGTVATTDFANYSGNDFRPASSSSPQVDTGIAYYNIPGVDLNGAERPNYNNGGAEEVDAGCFEYDHGYGPHPVTTPRGLAFTGLIAGSEVKVFDTGTQTTVFTDTSSSTSETWSENASGSKTVDYTILKDSYIPIRVTGITVTGAASGGVLSTPIQQVLDRSYITPSGLSIGSTATYNTGTKRFTVTTATTGQNWYSYMVQCWRTESALANVAFPVSSNGPNSFQLSGDWQFSSGINYLSRDGLRYLNSSGVVTDSWAAILSVGVPAGMMVRYEQTDGGTATSAATTGNIDQLVKIYESGSFDYTGFLVLKVQGSGYDQAEFDAYATYGTLEDQLYVVGLTPTANGIASGTVTGITITDHAGSPVTWNSKVFSITITDTTGHTGEQIVQYVRGLNDFDYHDLVQTNGTEFKTVRGKLYGDIGAALKGVRVVQADGTTSHADFNLHTADDGTTYIPPLPPAAVTATVLADSRVQLFNVTTNTEIDNDFMTGTSYNFVISGEASAGDTLRLRVCKLGRKAGEAFGIWSGVELGMLISQPEDEIYTAWGIDGSDVPEFSGDVTGHIYIDANDLDGATTKTRLGAWYSWVLTTEIGIANFYGAVSYLAVNSIRINVDVAEILIENVNATTALRFTDLSVRLYRSDGSSIIAPTSYSVHNDYSGVPDVVETGVSGLTGSESSQLMALPSSATIATAVWSKTLP